MSNKTSPLRLGITHEGQAYVDEPVYIYPKHISEIDRSIRVIFGSPTPKPVLVDYQMVKLRWVKPKDAHT